MSLAALKPGAAERHPLVERHSVADLGRLADHHAGAVVDEELVADPGRGMDLHPGYRPAGVRDRHRHPRHPGVVERVREAVREDRLDAGPVHEDLGRANAARGGVAVPRRRNVRADLAGDASQGAEPEHRNKG